MSREFTVPHHELVVRASRSSGAGGQHVNKTSSRIEITWNIETSQALTGEQRALLRERLSKQLSNDGDLRVVASEMRSQRQNRERAEERLNAVVRRALVIRKKRVATKPTKASKEKRLSSKKKRAGIKKLRGKDPDF